MKTCATCRFMAAPRDHGNTVLSWYDEETEEYVASAHRTCVRIVHGNQGGPDERRALASAPALVVDGSGYAARLIVLPSFGCNLHEERET